MTMEGNACIPGKPPLQSALYLHFYASQSPLPHHSSATSVCSLPLHRDCRTAKQKQSDDPCLSISHRIATRFDGCRPDTKLTCFSRLLSFREIDNVESTPQRRQDLAGAIARRGTGDSDGLLPRNP